MNSSGRRWVLVTAGSAGVGAAIARMLAIESGMSVVINYASNEGRAMKMLSGLKKDVENFRASHVGPQGPATPQEFHSLRANMHERAEVQRLMEDTLTLTGGRLDAVVSNHGWTRMTDFADLEQGLVDEDWDRCFTVNVKAHLWLFHAAKPALEKTKGAFITTASVAGVKPSGSSLPYAVTKAAQIHLVKSLALIAAPTIRVNCVSPGVLMTDWGRSFPQEKLDKVKETNKLKEFATVADVARQVQTYIESKTVTGQNAIIDAGFSL